jgi:hypothetical protein
MYVFVLLLIASIFMVGIPRASASGTKIELNPMEIIVSASGQNFTVDVNVTDVTGLNGFEFQLDYNTTLLDALYVTPGPVIPATCFLGPLIQ